MQYFTQDTITFFEELAGNNHKDRFHANKDRYETFLKNPIRAITKDVIERVYDEDPTFFLEVKNAVFRINRDIRFAKDKTPYKTHVAATINEGGRKDMSHTGLYMHFGLDGVFFACGSYSPSKEHIQKIREALVDQSKEVTRILTDK